MILALPVALGLTVSTPFVWRELLPPSTTIANLIELSEERLPAPGRVENDIRYDRSIFGSYYLDLYYPYDTNARSDLDLSAAPLVVFYHGGSWLRGDKITILVVDRFLSRMRGQGYYVAAVNYTTSPLRGLSGPIDQARGAIEWLVDNAERYGYSARQIGLYGVSAGGHIALMALAGGPLPDESIAWIFAECSPTDLVAMRDGDAFANSDGFRLFSERRLRRLSPITYVDAGLPPILLFHGDADKTVHVNQSRRYAERLRRHGARVDYVEWPGGDHAFLGFSDAVWFEQETIALEWFDRQFNSE